MGTTTRAATVAAIARTWPGISSISDQTKPRTISGKTTLSEHTWGNALDIFGSRNGMANLAAFLDENKTRYSIQIVCYDGGPGPSYDRCTTRHIGHIHVDFSPRCGGNVAASGTASQRVTACEQFQSGAPVTGAPSQQGGAPSQQNGGNGDGFLGIPGAIDRFTQGVEDTAQTALLVVLGVAIVGAGVALAIKDTGTFKAVKSAVTKVATKGAI